MGIPTKTPQEKLRTKINKITEGNLLDEHGQVTFNGTELFTYTDEYLFYSNNRYYPTKIDSLVVDDYTVTIPLDHDTLKYITNSNPNPPKFASNVVKLFRDLDQEVSSITIGADRNEIHGGELSITTELYDDLVRINSEEGKDKTVRFKNRIRGFILEDYDLDIGEQKAERDYGLLLREVITSGEVSQQDIRELMSQLETGKSSNIVIENQVHKQVEWLIQAMETILEETNMNKTKARNFGHDLFHYAKTSIQGPEHLMEKILSDYGQYSLFGVPALINTDKYVMNDGLPRAQYDLLLINNLGEVEVVELKRSDTIVLDFDSSRNKFYASSELSKAIAQTERYLTSIMKDNDEEFLIKGHKVREFLNRELGGLIHIESVRPTGLIIIGSSKTICKSYDNLSQTLKDRLTREDYNSNCERAFRELKDSHKNIKIVTYSDITQSARMRLQLFNEE